VQPNPIATLCRVCLIKGVWIKGMQVLEENATKLFRLYTRRCIGQLPFHSR
jgi:hypothetical protein